MSPALSVRGRRDRTRRVAALGVALVGALALSGCGATGARADGPGTGTSIPAATASGSPSTPAATSVPATGEQRQDGTPSPAAVPSVDQQQLDAADAVVSDAERTLDAIDQEMAQDE